MKRISIIAVETGKKKKQSLRLKRKIRNKQRKINAYWLQNQLKLINIAAQSFNRIDSRKESKQPVSIIKSKRLYYRLFANVDNS